MIKMEPKIKIMLIYFWTFMSFQLSSAFFDLEELKSFNYGIDIRNEPVVMKQKEDEADFNTVQLTSKFGQPYQCNFPNAVEQEKQKVEAEKVAMETGIPDLLKPMETGPCLKMNKDWWSYEFCYGKHIKQFHLGEDGRIQGEVMVLGHYESEFDWADDPDKTEIERRETRLRRYHTQQYVNGSKCDLNGKLRKTEVRFKCEEGSADYISRLDEPETCAYIMTVHTMKICHHPFLKPPTPTKTVSITCNPLLTVVQYQEYLDEIEAEEERQRLEEEKLQEKIEEKKRLAEEKAKYFERSQVDNEEVDDVEIEEEKEEGVDEEEGIVKEEGENWSNIMKAVQQAQQGTTNAGDVAGEVKTVYKVVNNPEEIQDFIDEAMKEMKKMKVAKPVSEEEKDEEEKEEVEKSDGDKMNVPPVPLQDKPPTFKEIPIAENVVEDEEETDLDQELDHEIKTLKDRYKNRRDKLMAIKKKMRSSMEEQYAAIIKEAEEELGDEGLEGRMENNLAIRHLTNTLDSLLNKLDKTEKEIESVDKELEQFAEYDAEEKQVKSIPPVKATDDFLTAEGPSKTEKSDRVKVRVSRIKQGSSTTGMQKFGGDEQSNAQTEELEKSVQEELEKAGFGDGQKIQVKIISAGYYGKDDDSLHELSKEESETFRNMIVNIIGGSSEGDKEEAKHSKQEENYSFVWGKDKQTSSNIHALTDENTDTQTDTDTNTDDSVPSESENEES